MLALVGFMAAGKTTVGRRLAQSLGLPFYDTDAAIERLHGPIAEIFAREGEPAFRRYESAALRASLLAGKGVVAVGGGAVLSTANRLLLRRRCLVVHLAVTPKTVMARTRGRHKRPVLGPTPDIDAIRRLMRERAEAYADSDLCVAADGRPAAEIAAMIGRWYDTRTGAAHSA